MSNPFQTGEAYTPPKGKPSKKMPTPFSRPRIEIGGGTRAKKDWFWVSAFELKEGDIIANEGLVLEVKTQFQEGAEWRIYLRTVKIEHGTVVDAWKKYYTFTTEKNTSD